MKNNIPKRKIETNADFFDFATEKNLGWLNGHRSRVLVCMEHFAEDFT